MLLFLFTKLIDNAPGPVTLDKVAKVNLSIQNTVEIWEDDGRSVMNLLSDGLREKIQLARSVKPELFDREEYDLHAHLKQFFKEPNPTDCRLRLAFWKEYFVARDSGAKMRIGRIIEGICSREAFYAHVLTAPNRIAWIMCQPAEYFTKAEELLHFGLEKLRHVLTLSPGGGDSGEKLNTKLVALQIKIIEMMDRRIHGAPTQRIEQKSLSISVDSSANTPAQTMAELDRTIAELEKENRLAQNINHAASPKKQNEKDVTKDTDVIDITQ